ncbi:hypothetical protein VAWG006_15910 [Aeromonas enteropelogenes]|nr:hypothetical protein VAWG006_15910 [Aeromonas enteropelogenes]BEE21502.1 hypothetical protein VAWG007_15970 [Aeromonas enteropelogenes]
MAAPISMLGRQPRRGKKAIGTRRWFSYFWLYGPEQAHFDRSWVIGDFEKVKW